jgi:glutamate-5-semialdehyde dehydrogenase
MESIIPLLQRTRKASREIQLLSDDKKKEILYSLAKLLQEESVSVIEENLKDVNRMNHNDPKRDRLILNHDRIRDLIKSLQQVANLPDPSQKSISTQELNNGLIIEKITSPLGVVGIIYESRPNVTIDVASLCLRSGNACVLRGGSDAYHSNKKLVQLIHQVLDKFGVDRNVVQLIPTNRKFVTELLNASRYVDIIIPRGSQQLIDFVRSNSKVPTIETGAGVCHTYVHKDADLSKALDIVVNAKVSRPSVCNALDTVLVDKEVAHIFLPMLGEQLKEYKVEIHADPDTFKILQGYPWLRQASADDFGKEFLDFKCSIRILSGIEEALDHIQQYSSKHSEAIVSDNQQACDQFLQEVDAAAVYTNASTRFTDGSVFGLGAEIGISTQKLHARGPFALEKLITEKWIIRGEGQIRT